MNISSTQFFKPFVSQPNISVGNSFVPNSNVSFGIRILNLRGKNNQAKLPKKHVASYKKQTPEVYDFINSKDKIEPKLIKNQILHDKISKKELIYIINQLRNDSEKLSKIFITETGCEPLLKQSDSIMQKICYLLDREEQFLAIALNKDSSGKNFFDKASTEQIRIFNNAAKKFPNVITKVYTSKDKFDRLPAHKITVRALESMNFVLADQPKILKQIYYTRDCNGNTPAHNRLNYGQEVIEKALKDYPEAIKRIHSIKNNYNETYNNLLNKIKSYKGPYEHTWNYLLNNY